MYDIARCEIVIVDLLASEENNLPPSIGTIVELAVAYATGKYVIVISEDNDLHPFITGPASYVVPDRPSALALAMNALPESLSD